MRPMNKPIIPMLILAGALMGCGDARRDRPIARSDDPGRMGGEQAGTVDRMDPGVAAGGMGPDGQGRAGVGGTQQFADIRITDAQIAHVALTANRLDSASSAAVLNRLTSEDVKGFARRMIREHGAMLDSIRALGTRKGMSPTGHELSATLEGMAAQQLEGRGDAIDRAYMENEVTMHQQVLRVIDEVLLPRAQDAELRRLVERMRGSVAVHLRDGESIRSRLASER
jgi:putative membrane protein